MADRTRFLELETADPRNLILQKGMGETNAARELFRGQLFAFLKDGTGRSQLLRLR
jgi:hypothetical protein